MVTICREAHLGASAARVWEVAVRPQTWVEWLSLHAGWPKPPPAALKVGSTFGEKILLLNVPMVMTWKVTEFVPPVAFAMSGRSPVGVEIDIRFDMRQVGDGETEVVGTTELRGALLAGGLKNVAQRYADTHLQLSLEKLAILLA